MMAERHRRHIFLTAPAWSRPVGLGAALAALLTGCAAVPHGGPTAQPLAAVAAGQALAPADRARDAAWPAEGWWTAYGDPQLDALIAEGVGASPDVAAAGARLAKAAAMARQAGAANLPHLDVQGGVQLDKQSLNMGYPPSFQAFLPQGWNDAGQLSAGLGFDLDLWGRNRAALAAATSQQRAAALDAAQARLVLAVAVASAYVDLDRLFIERDIRAAQLAAATKTRELVEQRQASGLENAGAAAQARAQQAGASLAANQAEEALALRRNQLAALVGAGPDRGLALTRPQLGALALRDIPADVTTGLVARRPDVAAARERVEAAASSIRVARAGFFPAINLSALFGVQALGLGQLFDSNSTDGRVGPAVSLPVFHGGQLAGQYRGARADYDAAVAGYNGLVLGAYQQAADAMTTRRLISQRLADADAVVSASAEAQRVMAARYKAGLATYLDLLQIEDRLLAARLNRAGIVAVARNSDIALVRALGGGFVPNPALSSAAGIDTKDTPHG